MSNLQLISNNTFGSGTNHSITNCFSSDYDVYKITLVDYDAGGGGANLNMRFIDGSGVVSDSDYDGDSVYYGDSDVGGGDYDGVLKTMFLWPT